MLSTSPILNPSLLQANMSKLGSELGSLLQVEAQRFIEGNKEDVAILGDDAVKAILTSQVTDIIGIPDLPDGASADLVAHVEERLAARSQAFQLVAAAQREDSERVARIQNNAQGVAIKISNIVIGMGLKAVLG